MLRENERWRAKEALSTAHYHCHMHWKLRYGTLLMVPQAKLSWYVKGCPNLGPPLPHPLSMVQSDVKRFGICGYTIYYGNKLFE